MKNIKTFLKKKKKKCGNMVVKVTKISQKMKKIDCLNIEKNIIEWEKILYCNCEKYFDFQALQIISWNIKRFRWLKYKEFLKGFRFLKYKDFFRGLPFPILEWRSSISRNIRDFFQGRFFHFFKLELNSALGSYILYYCRIE